MARRFGSAFTLGCDPDVFAVNPLLDDGSPFAPTVLGNLIWADQPQRLMVAPSAYSQVRKVVFWCAFRHEHTAGAQPVIPCRLRVAPSSTSLTTKVVETITLTEGTYLKTDGAAGSVLTSSELNNEDCFYAHRSAVSNEVDALQFAALASAGAQVLYQEFDRFNATDADFFSDWDAIAAGDNDDVHMSFAVAIERMDGGAWDLSGTGQSNRAPVIVSAGFAVVQAPSTSNNTRVYLPGTHGTYSPGSIGTVAFGLIRTVPFFYHADEWDGDVEIRFVSRMFKTGGASAGSFSVQISTIANQTMATTPIFTQSFVDGGAPFSQNCICRSDDLVPYLTDGDIVCANFRSDSGASQDQPYGWWEVTHKGFTKTTVYIPCGHPPQSNGSVYDGFSKTESLVDPIWFEDMESERFLEARVQGGFRHIDGSDETQAINLNANLEDDVVGSAFNVTVDPSLNSTPDATFVARKLIDNDLVAPDPVNLAGKRKLTERFFTWAGQPGSMTILYVLNVPNTDIVELGPLFDVGAFDAEGCAATSAGLGFPPTLVIANGSGIPQKFNPTAAGTDGEVEDAGIPTPYEGEVPTAVPGSAAMSPTGGLDLGTYTYRYTFRNCCTDRESDPNPDDITVDTSGEAPAAEVTLSFAGVRIPADPQICEICIYRTVEGGDYPIMAKVGCFNVDTGSIFVDDMSDDALDFTNDGLSILNAPVPCVPVVVDFRNRIFGMGDIPNLAPVGRVSVVNGSDLVEGNADVLWDRCLEGKRIKVGDDCRAYEILRVLPPDAGTSPPIGRLRLVEPYEGATDTGLTYIICGHPNRLYFSEPLEPEYWPAANFLDIEPGDGDRLMGGVSNFDSLVICKRRKTYVLRFRENPGIEVIVPSRISSDIGCIGPRTFAQVESGSVWLSDRGLALYDGRSVQHVQESSDMNDMFIDPSNPNYVRRDRNGRVIDAVGVFYPKREQYLLLLPTVQTARGCNVMVVWDVKLRNITILKFCQEFQSMEVAKDSEGNERVYVGDTNGFVWIFDIGDTDGVGYPNATGTVRGTVTDAGIDPVTGASFLDDSSASFITGGIPGFADLSGVAGLSGAWGGADVGIAGVCVYTRRSDAAYDDPWTVRTIYASTSGRLYVTPQWGPEAPLAGFDYMLGAIEFDQLFKPQNYGTDDIAKRDWRQIVVHEPESFASQLRIELLPDFQMSDPEEDTVVDPVTGEVGEGRVFRMDYSKGRQVKPVGRYVHHHMAIRMRNFAPEEPIRVINHLLCVRPRTSK